MSQHFETFEAVMPVRNSFSRGVGRQTTDPEAFFQQGGQVKGFSSKTPFGNVKSNTRPRKVPGARKGRGVQKSVFLGLAFRFASDSCNPNPRCCATTVRLMEVLTRRFVQVLETHPPPSPKLLHWHSRASSGTLNYYEFTAG